MALGTANGREVIIRLVPTVDESSASVFKKFGREIQTAYKQVTKEAEKSAKDIESLDKRQFTSRSKIIRDREREEKRAIVEQTRAADRAYREVENLDKRQFLSRIKTIRDREAAEQRAEHSFVTSQKKMVIANERVIRSLEGSAQGALGFAKNLMMLGLVGEKDTKKIIDGLIKIQAGFGLVSEGVNIVMQLSRAWRAVEVAANAATVAQAAANVMGGAGRGGVGRGIAGNIGGGLVGGAATTLAGKLGIGVGGSTLAVSAAGAAAALGGGAGLWGAGSSITEAWKHGIGGGASSGTFAANVGGSNWNPFSWMMAPGLKANQWASENRTDRFSKRNAITSAAMQQRDIIDSIRGQAAITAFEQQGQMEELRRRGQNLSPVDYTSSGTRLLNDRAVRYARGQAGGAKAFAADTGAKLHAQQNDPNATASGLASAENLHEAAIHKTINAIQAEREAVRQLNQERMSGLRQSIDELGTLSQKHREAANQWEKEGQSLGERLANMNPMERMQLQEAARAVRGGGGTQEQYNLYMGTGINTPETEAIRKKRAEGQAGLMKEIGWIGTEKAAEERTKAAEFQDYQSDLADKYDQGSQAAIEADKQLAASMEKFASTLEKINKDRAQVSIPKAIAQALADLMNRMAAPG